MVECAWVVGIVGLSLMCSRWHMPSWLPQTWGMALLGCAAGVAGSVITGIGYHRALWLTLGKRGALPKGWWWSPTQHHPQLRPPERAWVLPWVYAGATAFVVVLVNALWLMGLALR